MAETLAALRRANATGRRTRTVSCMTNMSDGAELRLDEGGLWAVRSASRTVCDLDLDRSMLLRAWVPAARCSRLTDTGCRSCESPRSAATTARCASATGTST